MNLTPKQGDTEALKPNSNLVIEIKKNNEIEYLKPFDLTAETQLKERIPSFSSVHNFVINRTIIQDLFIMGGSDIRIAQQH